MARLALNKSSLKRQRDQLKTYKKFLPSLELKRQQLQIELRRAQADSVSIDREEEELKRSQEPLLQLSGNSSIAVEGLVRVSDVRVSEENVVGVRLPKLDHVSVETKSYSMLLKPFWVDFLIDVVARTAEMRVRKTIQEERIRRLDDALRKVTQRVNLFEKVLIPQAQANIRLINIFLADSQRVAVVRSKIAKAKTEARREEMARERV